MNDLIIVDGRGYGAVIHRTEAHKADLIMRRTDPWGLAAFERRRLVDDPALGQTWFISPEDLILAKLSWSDGGASERQVRDCASVVRIESHLDWATSTGSLMHWASGNWWRGSVMIGSDQVVLDRRLIEAGLPGRRTAHVRLRAKGFARVWAQADRAGAMTELERARFLLRRLYPDLEGPRLDAIMDTLETEWLAGTWTGFRRPGLGSVPRP